MHEDVLGVPTKDKSRSLREVRAAQRGAVQETKPYGHFEAISRPLGQSLSLSLNMAQTQDSRTELLKEVKKTDWREDLKHVEPAKDASAPKIESKHCPAAACGS
jgi:hypothetical protein